MPGSVFKAVFKLTVASLVDQTGQELAKVLSPTPAPQPQTYHVPPPPPPPQLFEPSSQVGTDSSPEANGRFGGVALAQSASRAPTRLSQTGGIWRKRFSPYNVRSRHYPAIPNKRFKH